MKCPQCNTENNQEAKFCSLCGSPFNSPKKANSKISDIMLIVNVFAITFTTLLIMLIEKLAYSPYESNYKYIIGVLWIIQNLCTILIPLSIKNNTLKIIAIILTAIHMIYYIYGNIHFMLR